MKEFVKTHQVYLTPISPIHIGCGEDFEPTNYVIDNQVLYHFEPANLSLSNEKKADLLKRVDRLDLLSIQKFFLENKEQAVGLAHYFANVSPSFAKEWERKLGKVVQREEGNKTVCNQLAIERNCYLPLKHQPYIPGSSFKGAVATVLMDYFYKRDNYQPKPVSIQRKDIINLQKDILRKYLGDFKESKLRHLKFSDFVPTSVAYSQIYYALNFKKVPTKMGGNGRGIPLRRECILGGQYRAFASELSLWEDSVFSLKTICSVLNHYYLPIFNREMVLLIQRNLVNKEWVNSFLKLIQTNQFALVRLGKTGADSKVFQNENVAKIKIMKGKGKQPDYKNSATTVWLAATHNKVEQDLLPFGWALLEFDTTEDNQILKSWCESQPKPTFDKAKFLAEREARKTELAQQQSEQKAKQLAEQQAEQARLMALASMTENQRIIAEFVQKVKETRELQADNNGSILLKEAESLVKNAVENWSNLEKQYCFEQITIELLQTKVKFNKKDTAKNFNKLRNKLN